MMQGNAHLTSSSDDSQDIFPPLLIRSSFADCQMDVVRQLEAAAALITVRCLLLVPTATQMASEIKAFSRYF
jgi:hypothetical protein